MNTQPTVQSVQEKLAREGALFAADEVRCLLEQKESLDAALREILDICEGWTRKLHDDEKLTFIKRAAEGALSNPASEPEGS